MAEPKRKTSRSRRDNRRSHHALNKTLNVVTCAKCGKTTKPHTTCENCGTYPKRSKKDVKKLEKPENKK